MVIVTRGLWVRYRGKEVPVADEGGEA